MNTLARYLAVAFCALALPLFATSASAAEVKLGAETLKPLTGGSALTHKGLIAKKAAPESIKVAGRRGRWVGPAIVGGIIAGALIAGSRRAHSRSHYYAKPRYRPSRCERLYWRCEDGIRRACKRYYRHCY